MDFTAVLNSQHAELLYVLQNINKAIAFTVN